MDDCFAIDGFLQEEGVTLIGGLPARADATNAGNGEGATRRVTAIRVRAVFRSTSGATCSLSHPGKFARPILVGASGCRFSNSAAMAANYRVIAKYKNSSSFTSWQDGSGPRLFLT